MSVIPDNVAHPRNWPTCPAGHGPLIPRTDSYNCLDCTHSQPRTSNNRTDATNATDLSWHLRQADAPEETQNEKTNIGPAGNPGGRGRAISGGADSAGADEIDAWVKESIDRDRDRYRQRRWS